MRDDVWFNRDEALPLIYPWLKVERDRRDYFPGLIRLRHRLCGGEGNLLSGEEKEHRHRVYHFLYCAEGGNAVRVDGALRSFSQGDFFMVNPGVPHNINPHRADFARYFAFTFQYSSGEWPWAKLVRHLTGADVPEEGVLPDRSDAEELLQDFLRDLTEPALPDRAKLSRHFMDFLLDFFVRKSSENNDERRGAIYLTPVERGVAYIRDNYEERITLGDISLAAGLTKGHFIELFKRETGQTPVDYLTDYRLDRAAFMLCHGRLCLQEIAYRCGFSSDSYFSKVFHARKGVTPGKYRDRFRD